MKKLLVFIGLALACRLLVAQTLPLVKFVPDYPFAHFENNRLTYPGDSLPMERFFSKMDSVVFLGEGEDMKLIRRRFVSRFISPFNSTRAPY